MESNNSCNLIKAWKVVAVEVAACRSVTLGKEEVVIRENEFLKRKWLEEEVEEISSSLYILFSPLKIRPSMPPSNFGDGDYSISFIITIYHIWTNKSRNIFRLDNFKDHKSRSKQSLRVFEPFGGI